MILGQIHQKLLQSLTKFSKTMSQYNQNDREVQSQWPPFSIPAEHIPGCKFDANFGKFSSNLSCVIMATTPNPGIISQNGQMTCKVKVNDHHLQYQLRLAQDACLVQMEWFPVCDKLSCRQVKVYGQMDGRPTWLMVRWPDAGNGNTRLAWKAKGPKFRPNG